MQGIGIFGCKAMTLFRVIFVALRIALKKGRARTNAYAYATLAHVVFSSLFLITHLAPQRKPNT